MGILSTLVDAFSPGGVRGQQHQRTEEQIQKQQQDLLDQEAQDRHRQSDLDFHDALMNQGYKPSVNGMVKEDYSDLPGFSAPAPSGSDIPADAQMPSSVPPVAAQSVLRPIDKTRAVTFNDHTGEPVTYEQPTALEHARFVVQQGAAARQAAAQQAGDVAEQAEGGRQRGLQAARQGPGGITMPEGSGLASGQRLLPEEVGPVAGGLAQASQIPAQLQQGQLARASQSLGSVTTPEAYKVLYDRLPANIQQSFDAPDQFDPIKSPTRARMVTMAPADQQKTSQLLNTPPEEWDSKVDAAYPPTGPTAAQNKAARIMVQGYLRRGEFDKADAIIKDGLDQQGKTVTAVASAKATAPVKVEVGTDIARAVNGGSGNAALSGVAPHLVAPASAAADKVVQEAGTAQAAASNMKTFIDMARKGNKVAYAYSPVEGVLTLNTGAGIKRVNMSEIGSYAGAGSTADKLRGWLEGHVSGESIPPDILNDMDSLHAAVGANARTAAKAKLGGVNGIYGSNFDLDKLLPDESTGLVQVKDPKGKVHTFPNQGAADAFKKAAGIQ